MLTTQHGVRCLSTMWRVVPERFHRQLAQVQLDYRSACLASLAKHDGRQWRWHQRCNDGAADQRQHHDSCWRPG